MTVSSSDVVLITMPFGQLTGPSIGLSLLKAGLKPLGISSQILYFTLRFAEQIGASRYSHIAEGLPPGYELVGEWLFSAALFGADRVDTAGYIDQVLRGKSPLLAPLIAQRPEKIPDEAVQKLLEIRGQTESFLDECLAETLRRQPKIIGFTSVFQQQVASLALAKRLKQQSPDTFIVFGGANCEGVMGAEIVKQFPYVDAAVSGEGDLVFPQLVSRVLQKQSIFDLPGVYTRQGDTLNINGRYPNAPTVQDLDTLPIPDYADFFEQWQATHLDADLSPFIPFETARGCWWGQKQRCTFCGLNGKALGYRSKSAQRALDELVKLTSQYPVAWSVQMVDNILNMKYFQDFIPNLAARELNLKIFYEVKSNLKKEHLRLLRRAGIIWIQPGIESLSTPVLKLMRKGVQALQNIQLLKWCRELGLTPIWNILWGFPGEPPAEYSRMAQFVPLLTHLMPPGFVSVRLDRFSPYFESPEAFGLTHLAPSPAYAYIYPLDARAVTNLAYFFVYQYRRPQAVNEYVEPLVEQLITWKKIYPHSDLLLLDRPPYLLIFDLRPIARKQLVVLTGLARLLYLACDGVQTLGRLQRLARQQTGLSATTSSAVETTLNSLVEQGLMLTEGQSYLSLAIPIGEYQPGPANQQNYQHLLHKFEQRVGWFMPQVTRST
ncbi:MAG: RiPP maturation radical SAM C-methyltransferase [Anaerolineae bacterium]|nr:RiPP maturation radical SAM C-methyltransferase [Anaerolineae bacterium]